MGQVFLVSEPEAMFRSWIHDGADPDDFKVNVSHVSTIMFRHINEITLGWREIYGCGRWRRNLRTCALLTTSSSNTRSASSDSYLISSNHRWDSNRNLRVRVSLHPSYIVSINSQSSTGLVCGAESISNLVEEKLGQKIPPDTANRVWVLDQFRRQFDEYFKRRFGADDEATYNFELPNLECELSR